MRQNLVRMVFNRSRKAVLILTLSMLPQPAFGGLQGQEFNFQAYSLNFLVVLLWNQLKAPRQVVQLLQSYTGTIYPTVGTDPIIGNEDYTLLSEQFLEREHEILYEHMTDEQAPFVLVTNNGPQGNGPRYLITRNELDKLREISPVLAETFDKANTTVIQVPISSQTLYQLLNLVRNSPLYIEIAGPRPSDRERLMSELYEDAKNIECQKLIDALEQWTLEQLKIQTANSNLKKNSTQKFNVKPLNLTSLEGRPRKGSKSLLRPNKPGSREKIEKSPRKNMRKSSREKVNDKETEADNNAIKEKKRSPYYDFIQVLLDWVKNKNFKEIMCYYFFTVKTESDLGFILLDLDLENEAEKKLAFEILQAFAQYGFIEMPSEQLMETFSLIAGDLKNTGIYKFIEKRRDQFIDSNNRLKFQETLPQLSENFQWQEYSNDDIADAWAFADTIRFYEIKLKELINFGNAEKSPRFQKMVNSFNNVVSWIQSETKGLKSETRSLKLKSRFIEIASLMIDRGNYFGAFAVFNGIDNLLLPFESKILEKTEKYKKLKELFSPESNYKNCRIAFELSKSTPTHVPLAPVITKDISYLLETIERAKTEEKGDSAEGPSEIGVFLRRIHEDQQNSYIECSPSPACSIFYRIR